MPKSTFGSIAASGDQLIQVGLHEVENEGNRAKPMRIAAMILRHKATAPFSSSQDTEMEERRETFEKRRRTEI